MITKFNFVSFFAQAWSKAVVPANFISGFRTCGAYPLNVSAIHVVQTHSEKNSDSERPSQSGSSVGASSDERKNEFTPDQEMLFQRRYDEGYDLYIDTDYIREPIILR